MTASTLRLGIDRVDRNHERRAWIYSVVVHVAVLLGMLLYQEITPDPLALAEFTWLEETLPSAPVVAAAPPEIEKPAPEPIDQVEVVPPPNERRFEREQVGEVEPRPQVPEAPDDRLTERLQALRETRVNIAVRTPETTKSISTPARVPVAPTPSPSVELSREANEKAGPPAELRRSPVRSATPRLAAAQTTKEVVPSAARPEIDTTVRRTLGSTSIVGAVADRPLLEHVMPVYPDWAKTEGVEGSVTLIFVVLPDGRVKESVLVEKTSGYRDFDDRARSALLRWRFAPLAAGATTEQWGAITMNFRLRDS
jgi:TonB family protein